MGVKSHLSACVLLYVNLLVVLGVHTAASLPDDSGLVGQGRRMDAPELGIKSWWDGSFQNRVEGTTERAGWIDSRLGYRATWVKTNNQINYSIFRKTPLIVTGRGDPWIKDNAVTEGIVVGQEGWLFHDCYVDHFLGLNLTPIERLDRGVANLKTLQDELGRRDIVFLVILSPSKLPLYSEYLPDWMPRQRDKLRNHFPNRQTNYEVVRRLLDERGVHWVDGIALLQEEKRNQQEAGVEYRLFTKGGTHWSHYGASLVAKNILLRLSELTGEILTQLKCRKPVVDCNPIGTDNDLGDLLNLWTPSATKGPTAHPRILVRPGYWRPDVLWVGNSFSFTLTDLMDSCRVYRRRETLYVFETRLTFPDRGSHDLDEVPFDWTRELLSRDIVIIEMNEAGLFELGYGFVEAALEFLDSQPPP